MYRLNYNLDEFDEKLQKIFQWRAEQLGIGVKLLSERCNVSEGALFGYHGRGTANDRRVKAFRTLVNLCIGHEMDLRVSMGSVKRSDPEYVVTYNGNYEAFMSEIGKTLLKARETAGVKQRDSERLNGASQSQIGRIERHVGNEVKPHTLHGIFSALHSRLILEIYTKKE
jgi:hypothetical protein